MITSRFVLLPLAILSLLPMPLCAQAPATPTQTTATQAAPSPVPPQGPSAAPQPTTVASTADRPTAWIIPIHGDIGPSIKAFVRKEATSALRKGARVLVFEIDTFGGRVDSALQISAFIGSIQGAKTVAWIHSGPESMGVSWSAGALIAMSCSSIYMASGTSIGAAAPVTIGADGQASATGEKTVSAVRSQMAALAEKNGHPPQIALAMVDLDVELWQISLNGTERLATVAELEALEKEHPGEVKRIAIVSPKGKLLSLTANEALRYGLAVGIADTEEALLAALGVQQKAVATTPTISDKLVSFLTSGPVQAILILLGLIALFLEINTPGFGIPGAIALVAFLGVFGTNALLGSVGSLEMILFLLGLGLLAVEIFVIPGFGITGVSGLILISLSLIFSMQDFVIPTQGWQWDILGRNVLVVALGLIAAIFGIAIIALVGPRIRIFDRLTLNTAITGTSGGPDPDGKAAAAPGPAEEEVIYAQLVGKKGRASSTLRPSGRADIEGQNYAVEADGEFIEAGSPIEVIRVRGNRIIIKRSI